MGFRGAFNFYFGCSDSFHYMGSLVSI
jgi:hypothetical protein